MFREKDPKRHAIQFEIHGHVCCVCILQDDMDLKALGFDIAEGVNDPYLPGDCGIFVTRVDRGSVADGRLRYGLVCGDGQCCWIAP